MTLVIGGALFGVSPCNQISMQFKTLNIKPVSGPGLYGSDALSDAKAHLRVTSSDENSLISMYINVAVDFIERYCGVTLAETTWQLDLPSFPTVDRFIELPRGPVSAVGSMYYYDADNVSTLWASSDYQTSFSELPAKIYLEEGDTWEDTYERPDAVRVQYTAGYTWANLPDRWKLPIFYMVAHQFHYRQPVVGESVTTLPWGLRANLASLRESWNA